MSAYHRFVVDVIAGIAKKFGVSVEEMTANPVVTIAIHWDNSELDRAAQVMRSAGYSTSELANLTLKPRINTQTPA